MRMRVLLAAAVVVAAGAGFAIWVYAADRSASPARFAGEPIPAGAPAQDFALRAQNGRLIRLSDQRGRFVLLAFLYTHCTDVCPLIAKYMDGAVRSLGPRADSVRIIAVSVDPLGDTPKLVRRYVREHRLGPQFHWLIGTKAELAPVWQDYNVLVEGRPADKVVHAAPVYLIDRGGRPRLFYSPPVNQPEFAHDLGLLLNR